MANASSASPLMPKGTALWLIRNTALSFKQIADFCGLHVLEVQNLADDEHTSIAPFDPIASGQLTAHDIEEGEKNTNRSLSLAKATPLVKKKGAKKYVPVARRSDRTNAILWIIKNYPKIPDSKIVKLLSSTLKMVQSIRDKSYWNYANLEPHNPVSLYLCKEFELEALVEKYS
ncbi:MAG: DUF1013 domain-containing protein [Alphaproteobacteria bacterium]|nr:MAG: DUF1013 domain-containing protein [Alphaproteobacteria bacterium]